MSVPISEDYLLGPGDVLNIVVEGKADLRYHVNQASSNKPSSESPDEVAVGPAGQVVLPMVGSFEVDGKTTAALKLELHKRLAEYFKNFSVNVAVSKPRMMKVFVNGAVMNPGARVVPGTATVIEALLEAGIAANGSTRRIELRRKNAASVVDVYSIIVQGRLDKNVVLEAGDTIFVPTVNRWIEISGEVARTGRFELLDGMKIKDAVDTAMGTTPAAVESKAILQRLSSQDTVQALHIDLESACSPAGSKDNIELMNGDKIRIPSLSEYMPMVRMVGEFRGRGVFQRTIGSDEEQVLNKSGVYLLAQGKTVGEVIRETGGVMPQADLKNAKIIRSGTDRPQEIALDLSKLLMQNDPSADVVLQNGDTIVLPALADKVHIFGAVAKAGSYSYTPNRRLLDYIGDAGGHTYAGRMSRVQVIRGDAKHPAIQTCDLTKGVKGSLKDNPLLEPGDVVVVSERSITGWRDAIGLLSSFRLLQSLSR